MMAAAARNLTASFESERSSSSFGIASRFPHRPSPLAAMAFVVQFLPSTVGCTLSGGLRCRDRASHGTRPLIRCEILSRAGKDIFEHDASASIAQPPKSLGCGKCNFAVGVLERRFQGGNRLLGFDLAQSRRGYLTDGCILIVQG